MIKNFTMDPALGHPYHALLRIRYSLCGRS